MAEERLTLDEAKELLLIDKDRLDEVCINQADIFNEVAERHAHAISKRDALKDELSKTSSIIAGELRSAAAAKDEKITEKAIESKVPLDDRYIEDSEDYLEAKLDADLWSIRKDAVLQRSSMIKRLCDLYIAGYYTSATISGSEEAGKPLGYGKDREKIKKGRRKRRGAEK